MRKPLDLDPSARPKRQGIKGDIAEGPIAAPEAPIIRPHGMGFSALDTPIERAKQKTFSKKASPVASSKAAALKNKVQLLSVLKALGLLGVGAVGGSLLSVGEEEQYDPFAPMEQRYRNPYE